MVDALNSCDVQGGRMEGESGVTRSIFHEIQSWDIQRDETEGESDVSRSIMDGLYSRDIQGDQLEGESIVLLEVSSMKFILLRSKENKWKVKA